MESIIILLIIAVITVIAIMNYIKKMKSGSSCCSEGSEIIRKVKIKDKNKKNYPYKKVIKIGGMTCTKCAQIIENNFNKLGYIYAKIDFDNEEGLILSKKELEGKVLEDVIKESGYRYYIK
ncbi:heavy metal-associated domain-containing protein [uncultured Brachyspira sp.]|uniref:heavy-metal-associated domain-containing protein n=1 Tax=uncultured Brachyspira sp. TaxID=221953 RepID=UPI00262807C1|nr:heavy metal-associated domain-containing protein [uncultured Brachyspira sp.]